MAKKEGNNGSAMGFGEEISTIRDILMGNQMMQYESQFNTIQSQITTVEQLFNDKIANLEANTVQQLNNLQEEVNARFDKLEASIQQNTQAMNEKNRQALTKERQSLGKMLAEVSAQLLK